MFAGSPRPAGLRLDFLAPPLLPALDFLECRDEPVFEGLPAGQVQSVRVFMLAEVHKVQAVPDVGCAELLPKSLAALIRFDDREYLLYSFEVFSPRRLPCLRAGNAESRYPVIPERLRVALTLDQDRPTDFPDAL